VGGFRSGKAEPSEVYVAQTILTEGFIQGQSRVLAGPFFHKSKQAALRTQIRVRGGGCRHQAEAKGWFRSLRWLVLTSAQTAKASGRLLSLSAPFAAKNAGARWSHVQSSRRVGSP